jgi:hypothetical protein
VTGETNMNRLRRLKKYFRIRFYNVQKLSRHGNEVTLFSDAEKRIFAVALFWLGLYLYTAHAPNERVIVVPQILVITINDDFRAEPYQIFEPTKPKLQGRHPPSHSISVACRELGTVDPLRVHSGWRICCTRSSSGCAPRISSVPSETTTTFEIRGFDHEL